MLEGCVPWPEPLARKYREQGYWAGITLADMIRRSCDTWPGSVAIVDGGQRLSYGELWARARSLATGLSAQGLKPGERVVVQLPSGAEFVVVFLALQMLGAIPVLAMPQHRRTEIDHFVARTGASYLFIPAVERDFDHRAMAREIHLDHLRHVIVAGEPLGGQAALADLYAADDRDAAGAGRPGPDPEEVAVLLLSGGSTGLPKIIPRTHNDYAYNVWSASAASGFSENTVLLSLLPMAHNYNLGCPGILGVLARGGTVVVAAGRDAETVFATVEREKVTFIQAAVPLIVNWLNAGDLDAYDLGSLVAVMNGGAKLSSHLRQEIEQRLGCTLIESFGTTEGLILQTRLDDTDERRHYSSGRPISPGDEMRVVDEQGDVVADGEIGELQCRGPYTVHGYYKAPEINAHAFTEDGFYRMGDQVKIVDGYVYNVGRSKDLVNRGGEKISCEEVENHIHAMHQVNGVCVVAMPDAVYGEKACAFVTLEPGATLTFDELTRFLLAREVAKFKLPERLEIIDAFPLSPAGKILRGELRERIARTLEREQASGG